MTIRLTVRRPAWRSHLARLASAVDGLVPVVKGNGYGFGRATLMPIAAELGSDVCVGTIHELDPSIAVRQIVLTPSSRPPSTPAVLTVGSVRDCEVLDKWRGEVMIKLCSSMRRYGCTPDELPALRATLTNTGLTAIAYALHLPLAGDDAARRTEIDDWLKVLPDDLPLWVSHLTPESFRDLQATYPSRSFTLRVGTALWHGDKSMLHADADVIATRDATTESVVGYRHRTVPGDGAIILIGGGSAHGIGELPGSMSPFHYARQRLALLEPPHMHTSMAFAPAGSPTPRPGDRVDVQWPLINLTVDEIRWME